VEPDAELVGFGPIAELLEKAGTEGVILREDLELDLQ
jgi:2-amino-4-hydroxy-6-hydroxymethyldihydropteridine diphosphokinase